MPKMKKCTICGKSFLSCKGVEVCSAACTAVQSAQKSHAAKNSAENNREYYAQNRDAVIQRVKATRAKRKQEQQPPK